MIAEKALPSDFDPDVYLYFNKDVAAAQLDPVWHYLTHGRQEGRLYKGNQLLINQMSLAVPLGYQPSRSDLRVGVFCHIFYIDLAAEILGYLQNINADCDLMITTDSAEKQSHLTSTFKAWDKGSVDIVVTPNRGRDIAPKLIAFRERYFDYDVVLHMHSKNSPHEPNLKDWRTFLYENLAGSPAIVDSILECFRSSPAIGIVGPQHIEFLWNWIVWGQNYQYAEDISAKLNLQIDYDADTDFISGSMFWARPQALKPLLDLNLSFDDFPEEQGQVDATLAHAIERLYLYVCKSAGFHYLKTAAPAFCTEMTKTISASSPEELREGIARIYVR